MRADQPLAGSDHDVHDRVGCTRRGKPLPKGRTIDELHRDEGLVVVLADLVDRRHPRMRQTCHGLGLAAKPCFGFFAPVGGAVAQQLHRDRSVERLVVGLVDYAHRAGAPMAAHPVAADLGAPILIAPEQTGPNGPLAPP